MEKGHAFISISVEIYKSPQVIEGIRVVSREYDVLVCINAWTKINEAFRKEGYPIFQHDPSSVVTWDQRQCRLARDILNRDRRVLQGILDGMEIPAKVIIPVITFKDLHCPVSNDLLIEGFYRSFNRIYVYTTVALERAKRERFRSFPKVDILAFYDTEEE